MKKIFKHFIHRFISIEDIHELLAKRHHIALIWSTDDLRSIHEITDAQAWEVLQHCKTLDDGDHGITWRFFDDLVPEMFPDFYKSDQA